MKYFANNNCYDNKLLTIVINKEKNKVQNIIYADALCDKTSNLIPVKEIKKNINEKEMLKAFYLFARFDTPKFYDCYLLIKSKYLKELMQDALNNLFLEYQKFNQDLNLINYSQKLFTGNINRDYYDFYIKINTWCASLKLNNDNKIVEGFYQRVSACDNEATSGIKEYENINGDNVQYLSSLICKGDILEYQKLLDTINKNDKLYKNVIKGGAIYSNEIKSLTRKIVK